MQRLAKDDRRVGGLLLLVDVLDEIARRAVGRVAARLRGAGDRGDGRRHVETAVSDWASRERPE